MPGGRRKTGGGRRTLEVAFLLPFVAAGAARAQEEQYFAPAQKPRVTFQWDALARYDDIYHLSRPYHLENDVERGRFEFRPELGLEFSDRFRVGVRAVGDLGTDRNEDNAPNFDNYRSRGATIERWYLEAKPGSFRIDAGSFGMPLVATEMLWDRDIQTPGLAAAWELAAGQSTLTLVGAGFYGPQREGDRTRIGAAQIVWRFGDPGRLAVEAAGSYWYFDPERLKPAYIRQNVSVVRGEVLAYASHFRIVDATVRLRFPIARAPATVSFDLVRNTATASESDRQNSAFEATFALGRVGRPGDWRALYQFQYVERDAVLGAYNTDDWWFHSWYRGHRAAVAFTFLPDVFLQGSVVLQKRLDARYWLNRVIVDLVKLF
jgi:hypothetical protein